MSLQAEEIYDRLPQSTKRSWEATAGRRSKPLLEVVDELADRPVGVRGVLVLEWEVVAASTGISLGVTRETIAVNTGQFSVRDWLTNFGSRFSQRGHVSIPSLGVPDTPWAITCSIAEFASGEPVVKRMGALFTRQDAAQIVVNVPQQPAPVVNVNIDDGASVSHQDVQFQRDRRTGQLTGATIDGVDQPAA